MLNNQKEKVIEQVIKNVVIYYELGRLIVIDLNTSKCKRLAIIDKNVDGQNLETVYKNALTKGLEVVVDKLLNLVKEDVPNSDPGTELIYYKSGLMKFESDNVIEIEYKDLIFNFTNFKKEDCIKVLDYLGYKLGDPVKKESYLLERLLGESVKNLWFND